jgi:hypothetical protein
MSIESFLKYKFFSLVFLALAPILGMAYAQDIALYGEPTRKPSDSIQRVKPVGYTDKDWKNANFYFIQTELSPATLYYSKTNTLTFFANMADYGLGAPTHAAYVMENKYRQIW